jgi:integrase
MKRSHRARGSIYERKDSPFLWIAYSCNGKKFRENSRTQKIKGAKKLLDQRLGEIADERFDADFSFKATTMDDLAAGFLQDYEIRGKKSVSHAERRWVKHLRPFFGGKRAPQVTSKLILRYVQQRQAKARNGTINRELAALTRMFRLGLEADPPTVLRVPKIPHLREDPARQGFLEDGQQRLLFEYCPELWFRAAVEVGRNYGWRVSEVKSLRVRQVDFAERTITLDPGTTKNDEGRRVTMTADLFLLLRECAHGKAPDDFLLTRASGKPIKDFRRVWANACKFAGCPGRMFHDLRRTAARNLRRAHVSEGVIMKIGGWKTRSVFERYNICDQADIADAMLRLEADEKARADQKNAAVTETESRFSHDDPVGKPPAVN